MVAPVLSWVAVWYPTRLRCFDDLGLLAPRLKVFYILVVDGSWSIRTCQRPTLYRHVFSIEEPHQNDDHDRILLNIKTNNPVCAALFSYKRTRTRFFFKTTKYTVKKHVSRADTTRVAWRFFLTHSVMELFIREKLQVSDCALNFGVHLNYWNIKLPFIDLNWLNLKNVNYYLFLSFFFFLSLWIGIYQL